MKLIRRIAFSSGHRYWFSDKTKEENQAIFGPWCSPFNHGHNYVLYVGAEGQVDPYNGMVVNIKWIDDVLKERVISVFDQKSINDEVPAFEHRSPSLENLLLYFRDILQDLPGHAELMTLKLEETPLLYGEWTKQNDMISLTRVYEFAASHRLHTDALSEEENLRLFGKCCNPNGHGHNYVLEVTVSGQPDPVSGMLADLGSLDAAVNREVVDRYDHKNLNQDIPEFAGKVTTSEVVSQEIFDRLKDHVPGRLERVRLHETARNIFEVTR